MNICFLNSGYPNPFVGGVERVTYDLICFLKQKRHHVCCFFLKGNIAADKEPVCPCATLPKPEGWTCDENITAFRKFIQGNQIDVLHVQSELTVALELCEHAVPLNCKIVVANHLSPITQRGTLDDDFRPLLYYENICEAIYLGLKNLFRLLRYGKNSNKWEFMKQPRLYNLCDAYVVLSQNFISEFEKYIKFGTVDKFKVIHNPAICNDNSLNTSKKNRLLWVGRMCFAQKRPDRMIRIWERLYKKFPDWELYMVGDGDAKEILERYCIRKRILRIIFTGRKNPEEFYQSSKIFCMTSSYEGWGMVLTEAMSASCVPIAYNSYASLSDIIQDGENGYAVKAFSITEYCEKLQCLMNDEAKRVRMAQKGKESIKRFSIEEIGRQWEELYQNL